MKKYYTVRYRRKRTQQTNYNKRLGLLKSGLPRLVIRKTNNNIYAQIVEFQPQGDKVLASASTSSLKKQGYNGHGANISAAYLVGLLIAKMAAKANVKEAVVDFGVQLLQKGSKLYAVVKGAIEGGLEVPCDEEQLPSDERVNANHISNYATELAGNADKKFAKVIKNGLKPQDYTKHIESVKSKILSL